MKLYLSERVIKVRSWLNLPSMTEREIRIVKEIITLLYDHKPMDIFEYGSGFSTVYFSRFLNKKKIPFNFHTVDNSTEWCRIVRNKIRACRFDDKVTLHLFPFQAFWQKEGWDWETPPICGQFAPSSAEERNYIRMPLKLNKKFDLILVDGRFRHRCLETIRSSLKERGIVFLHDAQKEKYHISLDSYKYASFIDSGKFFPFERMQYKCWIGSLDNQVVLKISEKYKKQKNYAQDNSLVEDKV